MHEVTTFLYKDNSVRSLLIDDEPWFVAKDVCDVLGYGNSREAVRKHCREAGVTIRDIRSGGQTRSITFVNEGNLYRLIIKSNKPESEPFEEWVCDEVLPTIRKTGSYSLHQSSQADRTVDIRHFRNALSPSGLDIRYTLDLTRVITRPTQINLAITQRLTGIRLDDIIEQLSPRPMDEDRTLVVNFLRLAVTPGDPDESVPMKELYGMYTRWFKQASFRGTTMATNKMMASALRDLGYRSRMVGGITRFFGLRVKEVA